MKFKTMAIAIALTLSAAALSNVGQEKQEEAKKSEAQMQQEEPSYKDISQAQSLNHLHHINQKEVAISKLATEKAETQEVKDLAQTIVDDHNKADQKLQEVAKSMNVELQDFQPSTYEQVVINKMKELEGKNFEQAYLQHLDQGHTIAMNEIDKIQSDLGNQQVTSYVESLKPELKKHEERTTKVMSSVGVGSEEFAE